MARRVLQHRIEQCDQFRPSCRAAGDMTEPRADDLARRAEELDRGARHRHFAQIEPLPIAADAAPYHHKPRLARPEHPIRRLLFKRGPGNL